MKQPPYLFAAILLVVLSIALLAYFLGKEHGEASGLRIQKEIDRAEVKALKVRIDSLSVVYSDALARFNSRQPEEVKQGKNYANEQQRYHDERKALERFMGAMGEGPKSEIRIIGDGRDLLT